MLKEVVSKVGRHLKGKKKTDVLKNEERNEK